MALTRAVDADFGRLAFGEVEVGAFAGDEVAEEVRRCGPWRWIEEIGWEWRGVGCAGVRFRN